MPGSRTLTVALTRSASGNAAWLVRLQASGLQVYSLPTIETVPLEQTSEIECMLQRLSSFDWIIFTSGNSVQYFLSSLDQLGINLSTLAPQVAAIGIQTAHSLETNGIRVSFMPSVSIGTVLGTELEPVQGRRILIPQSDIASNELATRLRGREAEVTVLPLYTTRLIDTPDEEFSRSLAATRIDYIIFASPSAVRGFSRRVNEPGLLQKAKSLPVVAIGPTTAQALRDSGFRHILASREPLLDGILEILQRLIRQ